jgi:hypothetical protein
MKMSGAICLNKLFSSLTVLLVLCTLYFLDVKKIVKHIHFTSNFLFSGHEPIYFTENKEKTLRVSYDRDTHTIEYMN